MTSAIALSDSHGRTAPVTPLEIIASLAGASGIGWVGKTLQERWKHRVAERRIAADAAAEHHRHDETVIGLLVSNVERTSSRLEALQTHVDTVLRENGKLEGQLAGLTERCASLSVQLDQAIRRAEIREKENISLRDALAKLMAQVSIMRLELERHSIKCPTHMSDDTLPEPDPAEPAEPTTVLTTGKVIVMPAKPEGGE